MPAQQTIPDPKLRCTGVSVIPPERYALRRENGSRNPLANAFEMGFYAAGGGNPVTANRYRDGRGSRSFHDAWVAGWNAWHNAEDRA